MISSRSRKSPSCSIEHVGNIPPASRGQVVATDSQANLLCPYGHKEGGEDTNHAAAAAAAPAGVAPVVVPAPLPVLPLHHGLFFLPGDHPCHSGEDGQQKTRDGDAAPTAVGKHARG